MASFCMEAALAFPWAANTARRKLNQHCPGFARCTQAQRVARLCVVNLSNKTNCPSNATDTLDIGKDDGCWSACSKRQLWPSQANWPVAEFFQQKAATQPPANNKTPGKTAYPPCAAATATHHRKTTAKPVSQINSNKNPWKAKPPSGQETGGQR